jgi:hypothetical protein
MGRLEELHELGHVEDVRSTAPPVGGKTNETRRPSRLARKSDLMIVESRKEHGDRSMTTMEAWRERSTQASTFALVARS